VREHKNNRWDGLGLKVREVLRLEGEFYENYGGGRKVMKTKGCCENYQEGDGQCQRLWLRPGCLFF
jgi:hypothetical protein